MSPLVLRPLAALLAALALALPLHARASECEFPRHHFVAPADGAADVPTNAKIWVSFDDWDVRDVLLLGPTDVAVEMAGESMDFGVPGAARTTLTVWTPTAPLAPNTEYEVWPCPDRYCSPRVATFRTGDGPASGAPPVPEVMSASGERRGLCDQETLRLSVAADGLLVVDYAADDPHRATFGDDGLVVADAGELVFPGPRGGREVSLRLGAYAIDGSFSGWSDPLTVDLRGCSIGQPTCPLLLLLLPFLRRRRSRCRPRPPEAAGDRGGSASGCRPPGRRVILAG